MGKFKEVDQLEYPLQLVVRMAFYFMYNSPYTADLKLSEIRVKLVDLFGEYLADEALDCIQAMANPHGGI